MRRTHRQGVSQSRRDPPPEREARRSSSKRASGLRGGQPSRRRAPSAAGRRESSAAESSCRLQRFQLLLLLLRVQRRRKPGSAWREGSERAGEGAVFGPSIGESERQERANEVVVSRARDWVSLGHIPPPSPPSISGVLDEVLARAGHAIGRNGRGGSSGRRRRVRRPDQGEGKGWKDPARDISLGHLIMHAKGGQVTKSTLRLEN